MTRSPESQTLVRAFSLTSFLNEIYPLQSVISLGKSSFSLLELLSLILLLNSKCCDFSASKSQWSSASKDYFI